MSLRRFKKAHFFQLPPRVANGWLCGWESCVGSGELRVGPVETRNLEDWPQPQGLGDVVKKNRKISEHMGVSENRGTPKWMVYNGKPGPIKMDDLGVPLFLEASIFQKEMNHLPKHPCSGDIR